MRGFEFRGLDGLEFGALRLGGCVDRGELGIPHCFDGLKPRLHQGLVLFKRTWRLRFELRRALLFKVGLDVSRIAPARFDVRLRCFEFVLGTLPLGCVKLRGCRRSGIVGKRGIPQRIRDGLRSGRSLFAT